MGVCALALLAMLPVYYKTLAQPIRSEVWLTLFAVLLAWRLVRVVEEGLTVNGALLLGGLGGGLLLARQFGAFVLIAAGLFVAIGAARQARLRRPAALTIAALALGALVLAGWFYAHLHFAQGSAAAYARKSPGRGLRNQPASFYFGTGDGQLFQSPLRPAFPNQLFPIFYADTWGDYWQYFVVWGRTPNRVLYGPQIEGMLHRAPERVVTNRSEAGRYLGRVARIAQLPTFVLAGGLLLGLTALARWIAHGSARDGASRSRCADGDGDRCGVFRFCRHLPGPAAGHHHQGDVRAPRLSLPRAARRRPAAEAAALEPAGLGGDDDRSRPRGSLLRRRDGDPVPCCRDRRRIRAVVRTAIAAVRQTVLSSTATEAAEPTPGSPYERDAAGAGIRSDPASGKIQVSEHEAREVAEASREKEWSGPSFLRELFLGNFRLDLIHPFPLADQPRPEFQAFYDALTRVPARRRSIRSRSTRTGEYPPSTCSTACASSAPSA